MDLAPSSFVCLPNHQVILLFRAGLLLAAFLILLELFPGQGVLLPRTCSCCGITLLFSIEEGAGGLRPGQNWELTFNSASESRCLLPGTEWESSIGRFGNPVRWLDLSWSHILDTAPLPPSCSKEQKSQSLSLGVAVAGTDHTLETCDKSHPLSINLGAM